MDKFILQLVSVKYEIKKLLTFQWYFFKKPPLAGIIKRDRKKKCGDMVARCNRMKRGKIKTNKNLFTKLQLMTCLKCYSDNFLIFLLIMSVCSYTYIFVCV